MRELRIEIEGVDEDTVRCGTCQFLIDMDSLAGQSWSGCTLFKEELKHGPKGTERCQACTDADVTWERYGDGDVC